MGATKKEELKTVHDLKKQTSEVRFTDSSGQILRSFEVWSDIAPSVKENPDILFAKCIIQQGSSGDLLKLVQVDPPGKENQIFEAKRLNVWNTNSSVDPMTYGDIGLLPHANIACVLDFLRHRYLNSQIYTTADPLVLAINPFADLSNATREYIEKYRDTFDYSKLPPHVFYTSRCAHDNLHSVKRSQTIIVSGESGAGKTEATKQMMRYFATSKNGSMDLRIQTAIMAANPILESFGNAKTIRNNNSSRFGRFMQLDVSKDGGILHGAVTAFLLEKSRVLTQDESERSYHIFYQLCKGADSNLKNKYKLKNLTEYKYINPKCLNVDEVDDIFNFREVYDSFRLMNLDDQQIDTIWSIVSGVLLMGNVKIGSKSEAGLDDAAVIDANSEQTFKDACQLLFLNSENLRTELTVKITYAGNNKIEGRWKQGESDVLKSSVAKAMYEKLFLWIIKILNNNIKPKDGFQQFIGMLDIFGFEVFQNNSLEQLFINITNEMLQKNFLEIVFEKESKLYRDEGISTAVLQYSSNKEVIDVLLCKGKSVLSALEDQCLVAGGSDEKITSNLNSIFKDSKKYLASKLGGNKFFTIVHTIGEIHYCIEGFIYKNKDIIRPEILDIINASSNNVVRQLFDGVVMEKGKLSKGCLIGSQFMAQLEELMKLINSTEPHFVRCIKPNDSKKPLNWHSAKVAIQLHALSILEALQLRKLGYSYRRLFSDFLYQFKFVDLDAAQSSSVNAKQSVELLLKKANIKPDEYAIGKTMIFLKQSAAKQMTYIQRETVSAMLPAVDIIEAIFTKKKYKQQAKAKIEKIVRLQAHIRRQLVDVVRVRRK